MESRWGNRGHTSAGVHATDQRRRSERKRYAAIGSTLRRRYSKSGAYMGLRSRQRRLAGVSAEDSYDPEAARHRTLSLEDHLRASVDDVSAFNLMWKNTIGYGGFVLLAYEAALVYQMLSLDAMQPASKLSLCFGLKIVGVASILSTREYVQTGRSRSFGQSVFFTAAYALVWLCCALLLDLSFTAVEVSPLCLVYFVVGFTMLRLIGDNTKAEIARAEQLKKLRALASGMDQ